MVRISQPLLTIMNQYEPLPTIMNHSYPKPFWVTRGDRPGRGTEGPQCQHLYKGTNLKKPAAEPPGGFRVVTTCRYWDDHRCQHELLSDRILVTVTCVPMYFHLTSTQIYSWEFHLTLVVLTTLDMRPLRVSHSSCADFFKNETPSDMLLRCIWYSCCYFLRLFIWHAVWYFFARCVVWYVHLKGILHRNPHKFVGSGLGLSAINHWQPPLALLSGCWNPGPADITRLSQRWRPNARTWDKRQGLSPDRTKT